MTDNLHARFLDYHRRSPAEAVAIMARPDTSEQAATQGAIWESWQAFLHRKGYTRELARLRQQLAGCKGISLPCAEPARFDATYAREYSPRNRYWDK